MNLSGTSKKTAILDAAMHGFLQYGYHGLSMRLLAHKVGCAEASLYHYIRDKVDLARQVLLRVEEEARIAKVSEASLFIVSNGRTLALLPAILWHSGDASLQETIQSYYRNWQLYFLSQNKEYRASSQYAGWGYRGYWMWLGFWLSLSLGFEIPLD